MSILYSIQALRGIACIAVIFSHSLAKGNKYLEFELPNIFVTHYDSIILGHAGVDLFFVLSGFIIFFIHQNDFGGVHKIPKFIVSRLVRVVPIYWILTILAACILLFLPELFSHRSGIELPWLLGSFFFIPVSTSYGVDSPVLGVGWTLNYEMYFYSIFALLLLFKRQVFFSIILFYSIYILCVADYSMRSTSTYLDLMRSPMVVEFTLGVLAAWVYSNYKVELRTYKYGYLLVALCFYSYSFYDIPLTYIGRLLLWGAGGFFLVLYALCCELQPKTIISKLAVKMGDISYSAYLLQVFTLPFFAKVFFGLGLNSIFGYWSFVVFLVVLTLLSSFIFWFTVEQTVTRYLKRRFISGLA